MEENDKVVMRKMHVKLVEELDTTGLLLGYLYQENILAEEDVEKIKAKKTTKNKAEKLLKILKRRRGGLRMLIKALIFTKIQDYLGYEIFKNVHWSDEDKKSFEQELNEKSNEQQKLKTKLAAAECEIKQLKRKLREVERRRNISSLEDSSRSNIFRRLFRKSRKKGNKAPDDDMQNAHQSGSEIAPLSVDLNWEVFEFADSRHSSTRQSTKSAPESFRRGRERPVSRTISFVSLISLRLRNAYVRRNQDVDEYSNLSESVFQDY